MINSLIGEVCDVIAGQSPESKFYNKEANGLPFYQGKKEFTDKYIGAPTTWTTKTTKEAIKDDILMSVRAPVGPVNFSTENICIGRGLAAIRAGKKIDKEYLFYFLIHHENEIVGNSGAVFNSINKRQIENLIIPLPKTIDEQKQIVAILDKAFEAIDKAKANLEKNIKNTKELFESRLNEIFSQKGEGWEEKKFKNCIKLKSGDGLTSKNMIQSGSYHVYGGNGITGNHNNFNLEGEHIIIGRVGANCGNVRLINEKIWLTDNAFQVSEMYVDFYKPFLVYLLNYKNLRQYARQAAQPVVSNSSIKDVVLVYPMNEKIQKQIVKELDNLKQQTKQLEKHYQKKLENLEELKKSILQKAFSGELV